MPGIPFNSAKGMALKTNPNPEPNLFFTFPIIQGRGGGTLLPFLNIKSFFRK